MSHEVDAYIEIPHYYETELHCLVTANHKFALHGIELDEAKVIGEMEASLDLENQELGRSIISYTENFYDDLRRSARSLSLVGIVIRFDHWIGKLYRKIAPTAPRQKSLSQKLHSLNDKLPGCPVEIGYLDELITARNAIVHHDSFAEWEHEGKMWRVADRYLQYNEVYLSDDDISEAVRKTIEAVKWYDDKLSTKL